MSDDIEDLELEPVAQIQTFFKGEGNPDFEKEVPLETLVEAYASFKKSEKDIAENIRRMADEIKRRMKAEAMEGKKASEKVGERTVIFTRRAGSVKVDWEKYVKDELGDKALDEIKDIKAEAKAGRVTSPYISVGEESISMEVI